MSKKFWISFVVVFVAFMLLDILIHGVLLASQYESVQQLYRPEGEMMMWIIWVVEIIFAFFFVLVFQHGYKGTGLMEGVRYGLYIGLMMNIPAAYSTYAVQPIPYSLAFFWFLYGTIGMVILGAITALIYGTEKEDAVEKSTE